MLGLSATMNRKDGTTNVFKMFLGEVIHKAERKTDMHVEVRAIYYTVNDDEFNDTILDFRGKPQNSSMISKLCEYNRRTEFIVKLLCDFISVNDVDKHIVDEYKKEMDKNIPACELCCKNIHYLVKNTCCDCVKYCLPCMNDITSKGSRKERPKCPNCKKVLKYEQNYIENKYVKPLEQTHVIVMAHQLNILHYIYEKFVCNNLASVGYYIGGMKESELKKSEKKQIILSTYVMVSEGLDIPSLNAEFTITPKTDVVQTLGRMLRDKHAYTHPILYDFIDSHDLFKRQWSKRKAYYKKQNYKIVTSSNANYNTDYSNWKVLYEPKMGKESTDEKTYMSDTDDDSHSGEDNNVNEVCLLKIK
jgi:superfamily II DNA or RNA helicase